MRDKISKLLKRERPIIFSAESVEAILAGRKIQTRRVKKKSRCPYGEPGDLLWVRTGWRIDNWNDDGDIWIEYQDGGERRITAEDCEKVEYSGYHGFDYNDWSEEIAIKFTNKYEAAGGIFNEDIWNWEWPEGCSAPKESWRSPLFLPKFARRTTLGVVSVHVERVQNISEAGANAEGYVSIEGFRSQWDRLNKKRGFGWDKNPLVWVIEFEKIREEVESCLFQEA